nr:glycosyltransferase [Roseospira navarrensis]
MFHLRHALDAAAADRPDVAVGTIPYRFTNQVLPVAAAYSLRYGAAILSDRRAADGYVYHGFGFSDAYHDACLGAAIDGVPDGAVILSGCQNIGRRARAAVRRKGLRVFFYIDATVRDLVYLGPRVRAAILEAEAESYRLAAGFFVYHEGVAASLRRDYGVDPPAITVVGKGVPANAEEVRAARAVPRVSGTSLTLMTVGTHPRRKGVLRLIEAIDRLPADRRARLRYVVAGPARRELPTRDYLAPLGFLGADQRAHLLALMRRADLGVLLSEWEGLPGSIYEFLALGTPCWMSDLPDLGGLTTRPGVIAEPLPLDPARLSGRLAGLLDDRAALGGLRAAAEAHWDGLGWQPVAARVLDTVLADHVEGKRG